MEITEKEFAVIHEISNNHLPDQRTISTRTGISLGLTNLIIKRLIQRGYVKAKQLNQKKIQYLLTSKGFNEKARKSLNFTLKTIDLIKSTKEKIQELILSEHKKGVNSFTITGNNELAEITEIVFRNLHDKNIEFHVKREPSQSQGSALLLIDTPEKQYSIDIISYLSESGLNFYLRG